MKPCRSSTVAAIVLSMQVLFTGVAAAQSAGIEPCASGGDLEQVECLSVQNQRLEADLNRVYQQALDKLPEHDPQDVRGEREQLRKSERAWLAYKAANCPLVGAIQGGSNLWITHFAALCEQQELQQRIAWLKQIAGRS